MDCPLKRHEIKHPGIDYSAESYFGECDQGSCAWWVPNNHTAEGHDAGGMCAIKALAMKDSEGLIVV